MVKFLKEIDKLAIFSLVLALGALLWRMSPLDKGCGELPNVFSLGAVLFGVLAFRDVRRNK